jgi:hypothetical protein
MGQELAMMCKGFLLNDFGKKDQQSHKLGKQQRAMRTQQGIA